MHSFIATPNTWSGKMACFSCIMIAISGISFTDSRCLQVSISCLVSFSSISNIEVPKIFSASMLSPCQGSPCTQQASHTDAHTPLPICTIGTYNAAAFVVVLITRRGEPQMSFSSSSSGAMIVATTQSLVEFFRDVESETHYRSLIYGGRFSLIISRWISPSRWRRGARTA